MEDEENRKQKEEEEEEQNNPMKVYDKDVLKMSVK